MFKQLSDVLEGSKYYLFNNYIRLDAEEEQEKVIIDG